MEPNAPPDLDPCPAVAPDGSVQAFRPEWRTGTVVGLANGIADDRAFERMPILADALEEAGCDLPSVLLHCREPIAHEDHCWVLEAILRRIPPITPAQREELFFEFLRDFGAWPMPPAPPPSRLVAFRRRASRVLLRMAVIGSAAALAGGVALLWLYLLLR